MKKTFKVSLSSGTSFHTEGDTPLLKAAENANITLPYSCKTGRCSTCKCKLLAGHTHAMHEEEGLSESEKKSGWILSCVRVADSDITLEVEDFHGIKLPTAQTLPCRIAEKTLLAPDVLKILLRFPPGTHFPFLPGQYIDVIGPGGIRRSYSIANANFDQKLLEIHVRQVSEGKMSHYWFDQAKTQDLLRIQGPLGTFFLRNIAGIDLYLLATGTGIAPIKSMLESLSALPPELRPRSVTLLWGGRAPEDLYLNPKMIFDSLIFFPVLSRYHKSWDGKQGYIQEVLLKMNPSFGSSAVYACGSATMVRDAKTILVQAGLPESRFYSDAFVCSATETFEGA